MASCSAGAAALAGAAAGAEAFSYNRENYLYDRKMRMETEYKVMDFRIAKTALFREDVSDIVALTAVKMDTYLIVNAVQLGFVVMAFCEGRLAPGTPTWLVGAHTLCMAASFLYYILSVYFAVHATVASKSFEVKILTQWVRLPVPSWAQIEGARTYASTFEKVEPRQMFRVPFLWGKQEQVLEASNRNVSNSAAGEFSRQESGHEPAKKDVVVKDYIEEVPSNAKQAPSPNGRPDRESNDPWGLERPGDGIYELDATMQTDVRKLRHIQLVREALMYWQAYDGFARIAMSTGTKMLATGLSYYVLGYVLASNHAIVASWLAVILFMSVVWGLIRLDLSLTWTEYIIAVPIAISGPLITCWCTREWAQDATHSNGDIPTLMPIVYLVEALDMLFLLYACKVVEQKNGVMLPTGFRSVLFLDVFGWIQRNVTGTTPNYKLSQFLEHPGVVSEPERDFGAGPAIQSVRYDKHGRPVPIRVEQLPGAARQQQISDLTKADFLTTTFVPCEKHDEERDADMLDEAIEPDAGGRPWKIFGGSTALIAVMWFLSGIVVTLELFGFTQFEMQPLLDEPSRVLDTHMDQALDLLEAGKSIETAWPNDQVRPTRITCHSDSETLVASTRYALYTAKVGHQHNSKDSVRFKASSLCDHIRGDSLQDISLRCGPSTSGKNCHAVVLHGQGRQLSSCALNISKAYNKLTEKEFVQDTSSLDAKAVALAMATDCHGKARDCSYALTSGQHLVEMRRSADASHEWFPHKILGQASGSAGSIDVINDRYLGILHNDGQEFRVLDLQKDGSVVNSWRLPRTSDDQPFAAMCAAGDNIFFLGRGPSPKLWRFPLPQQLTKPLTAKSTGEQALLLEKHGHTTKPRNGVHVSLHKWK